MHFKHSLFWRILLIFFSLLGLVGSSFTLVSIFEADRFFNETNQYLHHNLADYLIDERFSTVNPFLEDGQVNKPLFGDIMHDMMAVNRNIEVYLLDSIGFVKYCIVLDDYDFEENKLQVDLGPVHNFIQQKSQDVKPSMLGEDPRNPEVNKVFSAASLDKIGQQGYIYIILTGKDYDIAKANLAGTHLKYLGKTIIGISVLLAFLIGAVLIWYLMRHLRKIIFVIHEFEQGDYQARIKVHGKGELNYLARQFNRMADKVVQSIEEIKNTEKLRRELVANISHDLRTPLAIIYGYVETFREKNEKLSANEKRRFFEHISSNVDNLKRLVDELFELSRLEAKQVMLRREPIYVNEMIYDLIEDYKLIAAERSISISSNLLLRRKGVMIMADPSLINRVLQNLLDNAIRFTAEGGKIVIGAIENNSTVSIHVKDSGIGISEQELPNIFKRYYTRTEVGSKKSSGLGLAIAKHIIELHESNFIVSSEPNKGSDFSFELPILNL